MKDIKERVRDKNPKIRNPAARLPKELVRSAVLEAKEKPRELHEKSSGQSESPTQYVFCQALFPKKSVRIPCF